LLSLISVFLTSGMMGVVYAHSDNDYQTNCQPCPGSTVDLKIRDQNEPWRDGVTSTWMAGNMAPGDIFDFAGSFVGLKSNVKGGIEITCNYGVIEEIPAVEPDSDPHTNLFPDKMAKELILTRAIYKTGCWQIDLLTGNPGGMSWKDRWSYCDRRSYRWEIPDSDLDGRITFYDLKQMPLKGFPLSASSGEGARFLMNVKFAETADNDLQGDKFDLNMLYKLEKW
jgi:hypothetical protein